MNPVFPECAVFGEPITDVVELRLVNEEQRRAAVIDIPAKQAKEDRSREPLRAKLKYASALLWRPSEKPGYPSENGL